MFKIKSNLRDDYSSIQKADCHVRNYFYYDKPHPYNVNLDVEKIGA